jgi:tRNA(Ile)-lysidine synthase
LRQEALPTLRIPETGTYNYQQQQFSFKTSEDIQITRAPHSASLDAAKVRFPLYIRPVREGDRFSPFGMKGSKLLSDYMTDLKFSLFDKRRQLVVTDCDNQIVWVVGSRPDNRFCITPSTTKVLNIRLSE